MSDARPKDAATLIRERYAEIWPKILDPWTQYLISARSAFDGDLDKMVILAVVGLMSLKDKGLLERNPPSISYDDLAKPGATATDAQPINIESIALYTGIPRESVRRKVQELIGRKWIARDTRGYLVVLPAAASDLEVLSSHLFRLIGQVSSAIDEGKNV
ncbi:hypothetical protein [Tabrizicola sp. BL-A-41-H6]|uniref:hypothetical protein n=1 Tax=Tabrizicola sp. BL-A-41-H6 TaxID=3421107 RepID=UPI003D6766D4